MSLLKLFASNSVSCVGDLTPRNGLIDPERLVMIKDFFSSKNFKVKPLFIMRDPFERVWSEAKMKVVNNAAGIKTADQKTVNKVLSEIYRKPVVQAKTRYEGILTNLEAVFDNADLQIEFFENLFSQDGIDRITDHCEIGKVLVNLESPNPTPKHLQVDPELKVDVTKFYSENYSFIFEKYGDPVGEYWKVSYGVLSR